MDFIRKIWAKFFKVGEYKSNISILVIGRLLGQSLPILLTPILARLYSPEEYGIFAVYNTFVTIVSMAVNGRYCLAILLPRKDQRAKGLFYLSSILTLVFSLIIFIVLWIWGGNIFSILNAEMLSKYSIVIAINIIAISLQEILFYYALRKKKYKLISLDVIVYGFLLVILRVVMGYWGYSNVGLFVSYAIAYSESSLFLFLGLGLHKKLRKPQINIRKLAKRYSKFPKFSLWADGLHLFSSMLPNTLFNKSFGSQSAGYYSMSNSILGSPIWLITVSIRDVFSQEATSRYRNNKDITSLFWKTAKVSFFLGFVPFLLIYLFAPIVFPVILGPGWGPVVGYVKIFSVMYFAKFVVNPVSHIPNVIGKQWINIIFQGMLLLSLVVAFFVGNELDVFLVLWSLFTTFSYLVIFIVSWRLVVASNKK
jgi:O-antigen/teichoic acid export membrane protein